MGSVAEALEPERPTAAADTSAAKQAPRARQASPDRDAADIPVAGPPVPIAAGLPTLPGLSEPVLPPFPGRMHDVGGYQLFVRRTQSPTTAEPALYVHGLGGASTNWTDVMYLLAQRLDGMAVDLPGFGHSEPPAGRDYSLATHVDAVIALLEATNRGPVHLVGNSLGGAVSTRVAAARPDLVRTLTLISPAMPTLRPQRRTDPQLALLLIPSIAEMAVRWLAGVPVDQRSRAVIELCYHRPELVHAERIREAVEEFRRREGLEWTHEALIRSLRGLIGTYLLDHGERSLWRAATRVTAPTLLIWGRYDRLVSVRLARRAERAFRHSRLIVIEDGGHVSQLEHPEVVASAVLELLDGQPPYPAAAS